MIQFLLVHLEREGLLRREVQDLHLVVLVDKPLGRELQGCSAGTLEAVRRLVEAQVVRREVKAQALSVAPKRSLVEREAPLEVAPCRLAEGMVVVVVVVPA